MRVPESPVGGCHERDFDIARELVEMGRIDQEMRKKGHIDPSIDEAHSARLKEIIAEVGWPVISRVGNDAAAAAWLVAQHATRDPDFQKGCVERMRALPHGEVKLKYIAYLHDRIQSRERGTQTYGTQAAHVHGGKVTLVPIEDPDTVDQRREEVGLPPLAEYIQEWERTLRAQEGGL